MASSFLEHWDSPQVVHLGVIRGIGLPNSFWGGGRKKLEDQKETRADVRRTRGRSCEAALSS